jgi:PadR family transcriptional regulator PadR
MPDNRQDEIIQFPGVVMIADCNDAVYVERADDGADRVLRLWIASIRTRSRSARSYGIVEHLRLASDDMLRVGESALYPALQRLLSNGWVKASWGTSENNRRARYYTLTATGRRQLAAEQTEFDRMVGVIQRVLKTT